MNVYVHTDEFLKENSKPTSVQIYLHIMVIKLYTFPITCSYACRLSTQEGMSKCQHCVTTRCLSLQPLHFDPWRFKSPEQNSPQLSAYKIPENRRLVTLLNTSPFCVQSPKEQSRFLLPFQTEKEKSLGELVLPLEAAAGISFPEACVTGRDGPLTVPPTMSLNFPISSFVQWNNQHLIK